jgi:hypothetical protein
MAKHIQLAGSKPCCAKRSTEDREFNEDGPAPLSIVARSGDRFTQRPDTLENMQCGESPPACQLGRDC